MGPKYHCKVPSNNVINLARKMLNRDVHVPCIKDNRVDINSVSGLTVQYLCKSYSCLRDYLQDYYGTSHLDEFTKESLVLLYDTLQYIVRDDMQFMQIYSDKYTEYISKLERHHEKINIYLTLVKSKLMMLDLTCD
jgi:hypothetical protein